MALAHSVGTSVEKAYRRGDLLEKRKRLMPDWSAYCSGPAKVEAEPWCRCGAPSKKPVDRLFSPPPWRAFLRTKKHHVVLLQRRGKRAQVCLPSSPAWAIMVRFVPALLARRLRVSGQLARAYLSGARTGQAPGTLLEAYLWASL